MQHLLIIEDDKVDQMAFERFVAKHQFPYTFELANSIKEAKNKIAYKTYDAIVSDFFLGDGNAFEILDLCLDLPVILVTGTGSEEVAVDALKRGAYDYLIKDIEGNYLKMLSITLENALNRFNAEKELRNYHKNLEQLVKQRTHELELEIENRIKKEGSLRQYQYIVSSSSMMHALVDKNFVYLKVNEAYSKAFNIDIELFYRKKIEAFFGNQFFETAIKPYANRCLKGENVNYQEWFEFPALGKRYMDITYNPYYNQNKEIEGFVVNRNDITPRKLALDKLQESLEKEQLLANIVRTAPVAIAFGYPNGNLRNCNQAFCELTGYTQEELMAINWNEHLTPPKWKLYETTKLKEINTYQNQVRYEKEYIHKDGHIFPVELFVTAKYSVSGEIEHFIGFVTDITERKKYDETLLNAKNKAEESDRLKSAFLANMSHEIRTPMNGILGFSELLKEPNLNGDQQSRYIGIIEKSGIRMLKIINDIIDISKIESGQMDVKITSVNINTQMDFVFNFFSLEAKEKNIQLILSNPETEQIINTDKEKLIAVLTNLVKNALKFSGKGSIEFGYKIKENKLEFFVQDTGEGIGNEQKKIIFERFRQGSELYTRKHEGAGLGLSISKAYIEMLGGKIWVESELGKGTSFYFTLPHE